ncbi:MAG: mechanosensitive ion channel protein MscS [Acidobacteria bacterium]|nr:MAG: mechanosensitive ion channel protein MscS [Acidobacteriota bacterium]
MPSLRYPTFVAVVAAFVVAGLVVRILHAIIHRLLDALEIVGPENRAAVHARAKQLTRALTVVSFGLAAVASVSLTLTRLGFRESQWNLRAIGRWAGTHGINLVVIGTGAFIVVRAANLAIEHLQFKLARSHASTDLEWQRRATTLAGILTSLVTVAVGFVAVLMLLREMSIDVVPIMTGAGIAGLAIGFGAQNLVRDVISGFFLILEDQVRIGDNARINGVAGSIEQINLRTIVLRDAEGAVQVFPNGTITALANLSKQFAYAVVDVKVAYVENMDRVFGTLREVGAGLEHDPTWSALVLAPLDVAGIVSLDDGMATVRVKQKTLPLNQVKMANELRRRIVTIFVTRGIRPFGP